MMKSFFYFLILILAGQASYANNLDCNLLSNNYLHEMQNYEVVKTCDIIDEPGEVMCVLKDLNEDVIILGRVYEEGQSSWVEQAFYNSDFSLSNNKVFAKSSDYGIFSSSRVKLKIRNDGTGYYHFYSRFSGRIFGGDSYIANETSELTNCR